MNDTTAILIGTDGEITTPHFAGLIEPDHPSGLVFWFDGRAYDHARSVNMIGSVIFTDNFELPLRVVCGPLLITGGSPEEPRALTSAGAGEVFEFLGLEPVDG